MPPPPLQGRLTLLLGPPGAGKSVFMQVLSGRMTADKRLRVRAAPEVGLSATHGGWLTRESCLACRLVER